MAQPRAKWDRVPELPPQVNDQMIRLTDQVDRGQRLRWVFISATTTYTDLSLWLIDVILVDTTSGNITINLPLALKMSGHAVYIKKLVGANTLTIDPSGSETIDGAATLAVTTANQTTLIAAGPSTAAPFTYAWKVL